MNAHSLLASASINIGLAIFILSLFSIFKKFSSNSLIYYALPLSKQKHISFHPSFTLSTFLPSFSWIPRAFRVTEEEILKNSGLDALVIIRLFKFGVKFFVVCSIFGLVILLPVNYTSELGPIISEGSRSMDSFTISNIGTGSNRLWVHFACLCFISFYGFYLLHKEYGEILLRRIQYLHNAKHRPEQFTVLVREIPYCSEHKSYSCCVDHFFSKHYPYAYQSYQMVYDGKDIEHLLNQATSIARKIEELGCRSVIQKHKDVEELRLHEEKLQGLCHKIRHIQCESVLKRKELPVAFVSFKSRCGAAISSQSQQHENPLLWTTEVAPEPRDVVWNNLAIPYHYLPLYRIGVFLAASVFTIFFAIPVTAVQGIVRFEKLKKWFPPAMAIQFIPGVSSIVTGYLPSAILSLFIYIVPFAMLALGMLQGYVSRSKREIKACNMVFYFLVGNVFFLSLLSGSLIDQIGQSFTHPKDFPSRLASAVSSQADFFMTYILTDGLSGFSLEIVQFGLLTWDFIRVHTFGRGRNKNPYLFSLPYYRVIPSVSLSILIGMVYVVIAPLLLPFLIVYFLLGYVVYINQIQDVYDIVYETGGLYWPYIHHYIIVAMALMQITMIGLFGLKSKPSASISTVPLVLLTLVFNEYCKMRFLPTFFNYSIQTAVENDKNDEMNGLTEVKSEAAINAYLPPCLQPLRFAFNESSSTEPLFNSSSTSP
ncbi:hypothetical protein AQUCO_01400645v1 [Aquilegia coerulea]|uniref:CSC1/OSCA1-like 7TM region domain-containing protein n=2 Tax=Aquilegia coerulea TaxID=218851 RepID=A0A2G5DXK1_AQUCA|nr:hypothetical protein AQUCO_01400645v1 [Aquilegia coerulea]